MTVADQVRVLCVRCRVSEAELARRLGKKRAALYKKLKTNYFTTSDLEAIADALDVELKMCFILPDGEEI